MTYPLKPRIAIVYLNRIFFQIPKSVPGKASGLFFLLDPEKIHMAGLLLASHPVPVREDQEMLMAAFDCYAIKSSIRYKARSFGASWREISVSEVVNESYALM